MNDKYRRDIPIIVESEADESGSGDIPRLQVTTSKFEELLRLGVDIASDEKKDANTSEKRKQQFKQSVSVNNKC